MITDLVNQLLGLHKESIDRICTECRQPLEEKKFMLRGGKREAKCRECVTAIRRKKYKDLREKNNVLPA